MPPDWYGPLSRDGSDAPPARRAPRWVRLQRQGATFTAFVSDDGQSWKSFADLKAGAGKPKVKPQMPDELYVGIGCSARNNFELVSVDPKNPKPTDPGRLASLRCVLSDVTITQP